MSEQDERLAAIRRAAEELVPRLTERLVRYRLGEIEVREGELRVRIAAPPQAAEGAIHGRAVLPLAAAGTSPSGPGAGVDPGTAGEGASRTQGVTSPAVGFFVYAEGLGPGLDVDKGDALGHVEMLGVRHDVRAPRRGTVRHLVTEAGDPVEYGQVLVELEPAE